MAKRSSSGDGQFNMAEEIRKLLRANRQLTGREVLNALTEQFPKQTINPGSCSVAYANARGELGIRRKVRKKRPVKSKVEGTFRSSSRAAARAAAPAASPGLDLLKAAKLLLQTCEGDAALAAAAVRQVSDLQMS